MDLKFSCLVILANILPSWSHLCLIFPEQRGSMDITKSGSSTCFRHGPECGGQPPETPGVAPYMGGSQMWIKIQQNYNHYEVGYPGYMDIAVAPLNSTDFQTLAFTPDFYAHSQDNQQNFTFIVMLPNIDCAHCVIRARYNAHKPGETIFYQCADIKIQKSNGITKKRIESFPPLSQTMDPEFRNIKKKFDVLRYQNRNGPQNIAPYLVGLSYSPFEMSVVKMMNISIATGYPYPVNQYDFNLAIQKTGIKGGRNYKNSKITDSFIYNSICAINMAGNMVGLLHNGEPDKVVDTFVEFKLNEQGRILYTSEIVGIGAPINAILPITEDDYYTVSIQESTNPGDYIFVIGRLQKEAKDNTVYTPILKSMPENLYINYQWAEYDPQKNLIYVLMGNENSPDELKARFYIFNLHDMSVVNTEIDVEYTFMSMHLYQPTGKLYAVSPGMFYGSNTQWHLIEVDPFTGKYQYVMKIADFGYFAKYYGGSVFNGISPQGILYHVFRLYDTDADVIAAIDINKKTLTFSEITNLRSVHNFALVPVY